MQALEEVVGQEGVLRDPAFEGGHEGIHVVEALAREGPLPEQVLVGVRDRGGVGIDARVPGVHAGEQRPCGARHRHADPGLQDPVALGDTAQARIEGGTVQGVGDDADELPGRVQGKLGVAVQGDAVADAGQHLWVAHVEAEARVLSPPQQAVELFELPAFALPTDPRALAGVPLAHPMEEVEPVGATLAEAGVQVEDAGAGGVQYLVVCRQLGRGGVGEVAEDGEVNARVGVPQGQDLHMLQQLGHPGHAREQRGDDDHRPRVLGDPGPEVEAGETAWRREVRGQALNEGDGELAGGQEEERRRPGLRPRGAAQGPDVRDGQGQQGGGDESDRPQVDAGGVGEDEAPCAAGEPRTVRHVGLEVGSALPDQVVAHVGGAVAGRLQLGGLPGALHAAKGHAELGLPGGLRQLLHRLPVAVPAEEIHSPVHAGRVALQDLFDQADVLEIQHPVQCGAQSQAGDGVGHGDLPRGLGLVLRPDRILRCHALGGEAFLDGRAHGRDQGPVLAHALQELHDVGRLQDGGQGSHGLRAFGAADRLEIAVGRPASLPAPQCFVRQPPQIFDQGELEHAGPGPQLADREGSHALVCCHEPHQLQTIQAPVGVTNELQRHGVDPRGAGQLSRGQLGQLAVVLPREVVPDASDLGLDEMEIVEQPFGGRRHEHTPVDVAGEDAVGLAQHAGVIVEATEKPSVLAAGIPGQRKARGEGPGPFLQALDAQELGAQGLLDYRAAAAPEAAEQRPHCVSQGDLPLRGGQTR